MKLLYQRVGTITKVCSARCYEAVPNSRCECICGGKLHAIGERQALEKLREMLRTEALPITRRALRAIHRMEVKESLEQNYED